MDDKESTIDRTHVIRVGATMYDELWDTEVETQDEPVSTAKYEFCKAWEEAEYPSGRKLTRIELTDAAYRYLQSALFLREDIWMDWARDSLDNVGRSLLRTMTRLIEQAPDGYEYKWGSDKEWVEANPRCSDYLCGPDAIPLEEWRRTKPKTSTGYGGC
jgi:hypothetical protein